MKVNGIAFKKAREEIRKNATESKNKLRGEASEGTQEWLAQVAKVRSCNGEMKSLCVRSIQYLEKGEASIATIDAVSGYLGVNGRELIINYGNNFINLDAPSVVDFRPTSCPREVSDFQLSPFLLTIDPLVIEFSKNEDIDTAKLIGITASIELKQEKINFEWLYKVGLNSASNSWLGFLDEVYSEQLYAPSTQRLSIMFAQRNGNNISWEKFIAMVEETELRMLQLEVIVEFKYFVKNIKIGIVTSEMKTFFSKGREKYNGKYPYFIQPKTIIW